MPRRAKQNRALCVLMGEYIRRCTHVVVDCGDCGLVYFRYLNLLRHGGRDPRQIVGTERQRLVWIHVSRCDGHLDLVAAHQGAWRVR